MKKVIIYELAQLSALEQFLKTHCMEYTVIACGLDVEFALEAKDISYESARTLRPTPTVKRLTWAQKMAQDIFDDPSLDFFSYRELKLGQFFIVMLQDYLSKLSYWLDIAVSVLEEKPEEVTVLVSETVPAWAGNEMSLFELEAPVEAFRLACVHAGVLFKKEGVSFPVHKKPNAIRFLGELFFKVVNVLTTILVRSKTITVLGSEHWRNISMLMPELPDSEWYLLDRAEARKVGLKNIWRNRIRFVHLDAFVTTAVRRRAKREASRYKELWNQNQTKNPALSKANFRGVELSACLTKALDSVMDIGGRHAMLTIEGARGAMHRLKPKLVIVRASVSAQIHFAILCRVARQLGIPSLEIQHGALYLGPGSYATRRAAEYIAEYGPIVRESLRGIGYSSDRLFDVGSPRFDAYLNLRDKTQVDSANSEVVCISPEIAPGLWTDTYDVFDYYQRLYRGIQTAGLHMTIKLRPGPSGAAFSREAIRRICGENCRTAQDESLATLFARARVVVSCYSTAILEALLSDRPMIYGALTPLHDAFGAEFEFYSQNGALSYVRTEDELSSVLSKYGNKDIVNAQVRAASTFMNTQYSFDGHGARRLANVIHSLAQK